MTTKRAMRAASAAIGTSLLMLAAAAQAQPPQAQELTEQRRIDVARLLGESTVSVIAGPSTGSGFVVGDERYIITNSHVIQPGRRYGVRVHFSSGVMRPADVLLDWPDHDLAVLQVQGAVPARPLPIGNSEQVSVGQTVLAFGSPFGLEGTLTQGIVSAVRNVPPGSRLGGGAVQRLIQTDAPINPGNSGGPLVSSRGEVIGVNTAILSRTGGSHGIGFAVPSAHVTELLREVRARIRDQGRAPAGTPRPDNGAFLGILGDDFRSQGFTGVRIRQVIPGGPADSAGLAGSSDPAPAGIQQYGVPWTGHIIVAVDGRRVHTMRELSSYLENRRPGQRAVFSITVGPGVLSGETVVTLAPRPADAQATPPRTPRRRATR